MSQLFYHHVGGEGARRDFPRSLGSKLTVGAIQPLLKRDLSVQQGRRFGQRLRSDFPNGFSCWAPPIGAEQVFDSLTPGDIVFLIGSIQLQPFPDGVFEYAGRVKVKSTEHLYETSRYIWTESKFPLLFFFDAIRISLPWPKFLQHVGYSMRTDPHGRFSRVHPKRYVGLPGGDPDSNLQHVVQHYP